MMQKNPTPALPPVTADLLLVHAPAVFDFRERRDIYFPYMSTSGDVPITPLYEYFPLGFKTLQTFLGEHGFDVKILNLASLLLLAPELSLEQIFSSVSARLIGVDLHWMVHVQGCLEIATELKKWTNSSVILGGISTTYYAQELIRLPDIDFVMRGYDTHEPMVELLAALRAGRPPTNVANLLWKKNGEVVENGFVYLPDTFSCGIDWSTIPSAGEQGLFSISEVMSTQNAGCAYNCGWCGGSREAFRRIYPRQRAMARKPVPSIDREFSSLKQSANAGSYHFYSVGIYNETPSGASHLVNQIGEAGLRSVSYEQFHLTPPPLLKEMAAANANTSITLSPESHDMEIARLAGRGVYSPAEMEDWIEVALAAGIRQIDIWYFIGMPQQDAASVQATIDYCGHLLQKFAGQGVVPYVCPMIPFLDPASTFFERPEQHGYRVFFRTARDHQQGMRSASLINRINYETKWLSRRELVATGYDALQQLTMLKAGHGMIPSSRARSICARMLDAVDFIDAVHEADSIPDRTARDAEMERLGGDILARNREIFSGRVSNQAFPIERGIGNRWFDELLWPLETIRLVAGHRAANASSPPAVSPGTGSSSYFDQGSLE